MSDTELKTPLESITLEAGEAAPLGATWIDQEGKRAGVNFAVHCGGATKVELCLFKAQGDQPLQEYARVPLPSIAHGVAHGFLAAPIGKPGLVYGYRVSGDYNPLLGQRYNASKILIDPYARALAGDFIWHDDLMSHSGAEAEDRINTADSAPYNYKCVVADAQFDWHDDHPPATTWRDSIVYELHVKGFTQQHPDVPEEWRGKYLALTHPSVLSYLKRLGITAVELLPVQGFVNERELLARGLRNYWGYNPIAYFAPAPQYAIHDAVLEFKQMVAALHAADIEVILDVVFNHTAEGNERGPTLSFKGFDNAAYYRLDPHVPRHYQDRTGCGNTIAIGHPIMRQMVIDCLRYWVEEMHVDGFRFDLAPVLGRDEGRFRPDGQFFKALANESSLRYVKLIAEPWDVGPDGYQLSRFPSGWSEWNDLYRDTMRGFWRGNPGDRGRFAERFAGSSDLFRSSGRRPTASINYVACHDGFTLHDLTAYNDKHNDANGEHNHDGHNYNLSCNFGMEGPTDNAVVNELRERQQRNLIATLLLSQGVPMLQAGDEFGRTQAGNNNAYCQDNPYGWLDWSLMQRNAERVDFVSTVIALRKHSAGLRRDTFMKGARQADREHKDVSWRQHDGNELHVADWHDANARSIGVLIGHAFDNPKGVTDGHLLFLCNAGDTSIVFNLPISLRDAQWLMIFDTARRYTDSGARGCISGQCYEVAAHSCVLLADGQIPTQLLSMSPLLPMRMTND